MEDNHFKNYLRSIIF